MRSQAATPHALSMTPYAGEHFDGRTLRERSGITYSYSGAAVAVARGGERIETPIAWVFGAGTQAVTPVIERNGRWVEHRLSWYREGNRLGLSPGHDPQAPLDLDAALGIEQSDRNAARCFGCHQSMGQPGVTCQACHGDAAAHRLKPGRGNVKRDRGVALCAACHRSPDTQFASAMPEIEDPRSIRFAPVGFLASKCYQKGKGFTCVSCHDPHGEARRPALAAVCGGCHAKARGKCPRSADCASCHMKASSPMPGLRFTDHRIRVE